MFTGLIEEIGAVQSIETTREGSRLTVSAACVLESLAVGDSISIDGVCTTVVSFEPVANGKGSFTIDASPETLDKTVLGALTVGQMVNLERPLRPADRLGGHFVTGHVDAKAQVISKETVGNSFVFHFRLLDAALMPLFIEKGSVAINGISLTVNTVEKAVFSVAIIPHTMTATTMGTLVVDDYVNIETDMLGKYVQRMLSCQGAPGANLKWLMPEGVESYGDTRIHTGSWFHLHQLNTDKEARTLREVSKQTVIEAGIEVTAE